MGQAIAANSKGTIQELVALNNKYIVINEMYTVIRLRCSIINATRQTNSCYVNMQIRG